MNAKLDVHNPEQIRCALRAIRANGGAQAQVIASAISCLHHLENVIARQRKTLADLHKKATP